MEAFKIIWERLIQFQGEQFKTVRGITFTYSIQGMIFTRNGVNRNIPKKEIEYVYNNLSLYNGPGTIPSSINGRSYIWAVINDVRISQNEF